MIDNLNDLDAEIRELKRRIRVLESASPLGWSSISEGALEIRSPEGLIVIGTARTTGTQYVDGRLEGSGVFDWSGPWEMRGNGDLTGNVALDGDLSLRNGRIVAGSIVIDKNGGYGGRLAAATLLFDTSSALFTGTVTANDGLNVVGGISAVTGNIVAATGNINAPNGDVGGFSKSFWIDHPTKSGKQLRHGSLEGPEHGVYYRGIVEFDAAGEAVFELPEYFSALVIPDDVPTVQVTASGRPFLTGAEPVEGGRVTVYGEPGREAHVTVTAARGHFDIEPAKVELSSPVPPE